MICSGAILLQDLPEAQYAILNPCVWLVCGIFCLSENAYHCPSESLFIGDLFTPE
jgi:hypothetical protein